MSISMISNVITSTTHRLYAQLKLIERSARVLRYHTEPTRHKQSVGEHTYGVMWLVYMLSEYKPSPGLLIAALMHDTPECVTGDIPSPVKKASKAVRGAVEALETEAMGYHGMIEPMLSTRDKQILKLADNLEGLMFCGFELRQGNREIKDCFTNYLEYTKTMLDFMGDEESIARDIVATMYNKYRKEYDREFIS